jgi:hypothetical protein
MRYDKPRVATVRLIGQLGTPRSCPPGTELRKRDGTGELFCFDLGQ